MSRSYTSRPSFTSTRGRGSQTRQFNAVNADRLSDMDPDPYGRGRGATAGRGRGVRPRVGPPANRTDDIHTDESVERYPNQPDMEQRMTYQGGYSMIAPNQRRRQQITEVAQRETQAYEAHRQQRTPKSVSYVGTVGGSASQVESRQKTAQTTPNKTQRLLKNQERKNYFKQKEEEEIQKKKDEQRHKAEQNEARRHQQEEAAAHKWDNQRRSTNEAFLNRLEAQQKQTSDRRVKQPPQRQMDTRSDPPEPMREEVTLGSTAFAAMTTQQTSSIGELTAEQTQRVHALAAIFPQLREMELIEALRLVDFSLDAAVDLLQ